MSLIDYYLYLSEEGNRIFIKAIEGWYFFNKKTSKITLVENEALSPVSFLNTPHLIAYTPCPEEELAIFHSVGEFSATLL